jgi:hypothetical protein
MTFVPHAPTPESVLEYYERSQEALGSLRKTLRTDVGPNSRFFGMAEVEIEKSLRDLAQELDYEVTLLLTASFEAILQLDFLLRVRKRKRDTISIKFRRLRFNVRTRRKNRVTIEEILDVWQEETNTRQAIGNFKQLIQFRHWLAHGRYWIQKSGLRDCDPYEAWSRGRAAFAVLPGIPDLAKV